VPPPATPHLGDPAPASPLPVPPTLQVQAPQAAGAGARPPLSPPETADPDAHLDPEAPAAASGAPQAAAENGELDGARLVALNMALNGESREEAERYLAENYELADRGKLIDEVFAAIEG
jgi:hypothetical protein